jgi:hypothetical protein
MKKTYFLAPNFDYAPDISIVLGQIWTDPADPGSCINAGKVLPFPESQAPNHTFKTDWEHEKKRQRGGLIGIWARFLQFVGLDAEASVNWDAKDESVHQFKTLDTYSVEPVPDYYKRSVLIPEVQETIKSPENDYQIPLYMITGVKIARGAGQSLLKSRELGVDAKFGVDGTSAGVPGAVGPKVTITSKDSDKISYKDSSDFVFAYRVREIYYEKGVLKTKEHNKGALYDKNIGEAKPPAQETNEYAVEVTGLAKRDVEAKAVDLEAVGSIDDDDEECEIVLPSRAS